MPNLTDRKDVMQIYEIYFEKQHFKNCFFKLVLYCSYDVHHYSGEKISDFGSSESSHFPTSYCSGGF